MAVLDLSFRPGCNLLHMEFLTVRSTFLSGLIYMPINGIPESEMPWKDTKKADDKIARKCPQWACNKSLATALLTRHFLTAEAAEWADGVLGKFWKVFCYLPDDFTEFPSVSEENWMEAPWNPGKNLNNMGSQVSPS